MLKIALASFLFLCSKAFAYEVTPQEALKRLMSGNARYVKDALECPNRTEDRRKAIAAKQTPFAVIIGCSDSRVASEIIFDQGVGDIFVVRVAGNIVGPVERDSIEYAIAHLHASLVLVLGHQHCGAVQAVYTKDDADIPAVAELIKPSIQGSASLEQAIKDNVKATVKQLKESPLFHPLISQKKVDVVGAYYHLESGQVELL